MNLTTKQQRFVDEYLLDLNATAAARRAGYSEHTSEQQGMRLLRNARVKFAIAEAIKERKERTKVSADEVLRELSRIGYSDIRNYEMDSQGRLALAPGAPPDATRAVASVKHKTRVIPTKDGEPITEHTVEFRLWDKNTALSNLGKHLGLFPNRMEVGGVDGEPVQVTVTRRIVRADADKP